MANRDDDLVVDDSFLDSVDIDEDQDQEWIDGDDVEGQLNVDVYQTKDKVIIKAPIAGVKSEDLDVATSEDVVTIRGTREEDKSVSKDDYYIQECFWGPFSRSVILPTSTVAEKADASLKDGVLTITIPKLAQEKVKKIKVKEG